MGSVKKANKKDFDIKQLFLNNVQMQQLCRLKTDLTQMYSYSVDKNLHYLVWSFLRRIVHC